MSFLSSIPLWVIPLILQIFLFIVLFVIIIRSKSIPEILISVFLLFIFTFYYSESIVWLIRQVDSLPSQYLNIFSHISSSLWNYRLFMLGLIPDWEGFFLFGRNFMQIKVDQQFIESYMPIIILILGLLIRFGISRYIKNEKLRRLAREYWLFITGYLIIAAIVSAITHLNFIWMLIIPLIIIFFVSAGIFRLFSDIVNAIWKILVLIVEYSKLLFKYLTLLGAKIAKFLRRIIKVIIDFYNNYIVRPLQWLYNKLQELREKADKVVDNLLDKEKYDDD